MDWLQSISTETCDKKQSKNMTKPHILKTKYSLYLVLTSHFREQHEIFNSGETYLIS